MNRIVFSSVVLGSGLADASNGQRPDRHVGRTIFAGPLDDLVFQPLGRVNPQEWIELRKGSVDDLVELGLAEDDTEDDTEETEPEAGRAVDSRVGFAGSVVALVMAAVAGIALLVWVVLFWLAPPFVAWLDSHGV
jgi:hypothetical protein